MDLYIKLFISLIEGREGSLPFHRLGSHVQLYPGHGLSIYKAPTSASHEVGTLPKNIGWENTLELGELER